MTKIEDLKKKIITFKGINVELKGDLKLFANYKLIPFELLVKADWNYKIDNDKRKEDLLQNLKRIGQVENILVRELDTGYYEVINGNHRYDVFADMGTQFVLSYDFGHISDAQAKRVAVETNETKFEVDNIKLAETIKDITLEFSFDEIEITMPFTMPELENFGELLEFNWDEINNNPTDSEEEKGKKNKCPKCGFEW